MKRLLPFLTLILLTIPATAQRFDWAISYGGGNRDEAFDVVRDQNGHLISVGWFSGTVDFDPGTGTANLTEVSSNDGDIYIQKLDADGNFVWAKSVGSIDSDRAFGVTVDDTNNIYITGYFSNTVDFDPGAGVFNVLAAGSNEDLFILKLDSNGDFVWVKTIGNTFRDRGHAIENDGMGNLLITGEYKGTVDFDPGADTLEFTNNGSNGIFALKLDLNGNLVWARGLDGQGTGYAITNDVNGDIYVTGEYRDNIDFDPGPGTFTLTQSSSYEVFVWKLTAAGNFGWAGAFTGSSGDIGYAIGTDLADGVYVGGYFESTTDFDPGPGTVNKTSQGQDDLFVVKLDTAGNFNWVQTIGGTRDEVVNDLKIRPNGQIYLTGDFNNTVDFDPGPGTYNMSADGTFDEAIFVLNLDTAGNFNWAVAVAPPSYGTGRALELENNGHTYVTGEFSGTADFDPGVGILNLSSNGGNDAFLIKLCEARDTTLNLVACDSFLFGGNTLLSNGSYLDTLPNSVGCDSIITLNLTITTTNFDTVNKTALESYLFNGNLLNTSGTYVDTIANQFGCDSIITLNLTVTDSNNIPAGYNTCFAYNWGNTNYEAVSDLQTDALGNVYVTGRFTDSIDIDPGAGIQYLYSAGSFDAYVAKMDNDGNLIWALAYGGNDNDDVWEIKLDATGNIFLTGSFRGTADLDPGAGVVNYVSNGNTDGYLLKLDNNGNYLWSTVMGGNGWDNGTHLAIATDGAIFCTGHFDDAVDFDPGPGTFNLNPAGSNRDMFISRFDAAGNWEWSLKVGGSEWENANTLLLDGAGDLYLAGSFKGSVDFDPGAGASFMSAPGSQGDAYILKLDTAGNYLWSIQPARGSGFSGIYEMIYDGGDKLYLAGRFDNDADFDPGAGTFTLSAGSNTEIFAQELDTAGNFGWVSQVLAVGQCQGYDLVMTSDTSLYMTGYFTGTADFDPGAGVNNLTGVDWETFIWGLHNDGTFKDAWRMGGTLDDFGLCIAVDGNDNIFTGGNFESTADYDTHGSDFDLVSNGDNDAYLHKLCLCTPTYSVTNETTCTSFDFNGDTLTSTGTYTDTLTNSVGCDSLAQLNLTILTPVFTTLLDTACTAFVFGGDTLKNSGTYMDTLTAASTCDSIVTLELTIANTSDIFSVSVCNSYTVPSGNATYTSSGIYMDTIPNAAGCDSILTINLTVADGSTFSHNVIACDSYTVPSGDETYTSSGAYPDTIPNSVGCDSILTINLTVNYTTMDTINPVVCDSYTVPSGNATYTSGGAYMDTIPNTSGCDSAITINLTVNNSSGNTLSPVVCDSYTVPSGDETHTASGVYMDTVPNTAGCDSLLTINLTVNSTTTATINPVACNSYTVPSGDETYTTSGTHMDTISNATGCDSIFTINLTVNNSSGATINAVGCGIYTVPSGDESYTTSGTYMDTIHNDKGCDSILTIQLTIDNGSSSTHNETACAQYTVPSGDETYTVDGTYMDTIPNANGCDSVLTINLTISTVLTNTINPVACPSYTVPSGSNTYTMSGTYLDTLISNNGCDSILTINLTIVPFLTGMINSVVCDSYTVPSGDETYTASGLYTDTLTAVDGCDSVITINLNVNNSTTATISPAECNSYTVPSGNASYTSSGTYSDTISNAAGCDSILTINLTIHTFSFATISPVVCESYTVPSGDETYSSSGTYLDTISNANGCDSILTINLTINNATSATLNELACGSYTVPSGNTTYSVSGTYMDTIPNANNCDSILTVNLTITGNTIATINPTDCSTYTVPSGNDTYTISGTYLDTIPNTAGCDSIITIHLSINNSSASINPIVCSSYTVPSGDETYTSNGTYFDTIPNNSGCDSLLTINLTIGNTSFATLNPVACDSYTVPSGNATYTASGIYMDTIPNATGCDSALTINLTVNNSTTVSIDPSACESYTVPSGNATYTSSGSYTDTIVNAAGCDSIITINLSVITVDASVSVSGNILTANMAGATYQWLDCENDHALIPGQTTQSYAPKVSGNFAVQVSMDACADTSDCEAIIISGIAELSAGMPLTVYPNPFSQRTTIGFTPPRSYSNVRLAIYSSTGTFIAMLFDGTAQAGQPCKVQVSGKDLSAGLYLYKFDTGEETIYGKIVLVK